MRETLVFHVTLDLDVDEALAADEVASLRQKLEWLSAGLVDHTSRVVEQVTVDLGDRYTVPDKESDDEPTDTEEDWARYREEEGLPPL